MSVKYLVRIALAGVLGCSSKPVDVGSYVGEDFWGWTDEKTCAAGPQLPIVGTWTGFTDDPLAPSRSTAVRLVVSHANGKRACGTLTFGREAPPWPPAIDAEAAYPPELSNARQPSFRNYLALLEGVPLTLTNSRVEPPHVAFRASYAQWKDWCALQRPYACEDVAEPEYFCIPVSGPGGLEPRVKYEPNIGCVTFYDGEQRVIDCGKVALCLNGPCRCNAEQCFAPPVWGNEYDLEFDGDTAVGSGMHLTKEH